jgi:putative transposase
MPRKPRLQVAGATYHITTHAVAELSVLAGEKTNTMFLGLLADIAKSYELSIRVFCLMTTHYHLLVTTHKPNVGDAMRQLNGQYARWFNHEQGRRGHVWDGRYHGDPIATDSHLLECIRYIALNPVRAGLCATPQKWVWSSYAALIGGAATPTFVNAAPVLRLFGPTRRSAVENIRGFVEIAARPDAAGLALAA